MDWLCGKHQLQGVRGRSAPPAGSARGSARSHARSNEPGSQVREGQRRLANLTFEEQHEDTRR